MKVKFIEDILTIQEGEWVEDIFIIRGRRFNLRKDGKPYLTLRIGDRTGTMECKIWDNVDEVKNILEPHKIVRIKGVVTHYQGVKEIHVREITRIEEEKIRIEDFLEPPPVDIDDLKRTLYKIITQIKHPHLKRLLTLFYEDREFMDRFSTWPAAKEIHHAHMGGLLEHSVEVARLALHMKELFKDVNGDLLVTGAILHDIGKIKELKIGESFNYSDEGRLIGHILLGVEMVEEKIKEIPDFPPVLAMLLKHLIISHQGTQAWGSPKVPQTLEAIILHYIDDLSAKVNIFRRAIRESRDGEGNFSEFVKPLGRYIYKSGLAEDSEKDYYREEAPSDPLQEKLF